MLLLLGGNQGLQTIGQLMYFVFSQCEIKERTESFIVYFLGLITLKVKLVISNLITF